MFKIYDAYEARESIKAAGGRWNSVGKFWSLTSEQYAALPDGALTSCRVVSPPAALTIVEAINGERFHFELRPTPTAQGIGYAVCAVTEHGVIAAWIKTTVTRARGASTYYDRHRAAKGDTAESEDFFEQLGVTKRVARIVAAQADPVFAAANWYAPTDRDGDEFQQHEAMLGHVPGSCAWFGNTDKKLIKKIQAAQAAATFVLE